MKNVKKIISLVLSFAIMVLIFPVPVSAAADEIVYSTNNQTDYRTDTNIIEGGRWSYLNLTDIANPVPSLLIQGNGGSMYSSEEWCASLSKPENTWKVGPGGSITTDGRPIAYNYTIGDELDGKKIRIQGTFKAPDASHGGFKILKTADTTTDAAIEVASSDVLFSNAENGDCSFDIKLSVAKGNDILFIGYGNALYWVSGTLDATISQTAPDVIATVTSGAIEAGTEIGMNVSDGSNSKIYYTIDGSDPKSSETRKEYLGALKIGIPTTVKACAEFFGDTGDVAVFNYTIVPTKSGATNNITDYHTDTNVIDGGRWSYLNLGNIDNPIPSLLIKGDGGSYYTTEEWCFSLTKPEKTWKVGPQGKITTDSRPIAYNYTVGDDLDGKEIRIQGTYTAADTTDGFRILKTSDTNVSAVSGAFETIYTNTGTGSCTFDIKLSGIKGNDILFVGHGFARYWMSGKLDTTISSPQVDKVTTDIPEGTVQENQPISLTTTTGASIYYTIDGTDPYTSGQLYLSPIIVTANTVIKAYATMTGLIDSEVSTFIYEVMKAENDKNPISNNITNYDLVKNTIDSGKWSYISLNNDLSSPQLLIKGDGNKFAIDEWTKNNSNGNHLEYLKADGSISPDHSAIAYNFTVDSGRAQYPLRLEGTFNVGASGRFRVVISKDTNPNAIEGPYDVLMDYTGKTKNFKISDYTPVAGNDILFIASESSYVWNPGKLDVSVVTEVIPQVENVNISPNPDDQQIEVGEKVSLSTTTDVNVYYTNDGSDPRTSNTKISYIEPFTLNADTVIKACAKKEGMETSSVATSNYILFTPFRNFIGACSGSNVKEVAGMRWDRVDFSWADIEPEADGGFNEEALKSFKERVMENKANGINTLPILCYNTKWSANANEYSYTFQGKIYEYGVATSISDTKFKRNLTIRDAATNNIISQELNKQFNKWNAMMDPAMVERWEAFVQKVVDEFSQSPYNIEYFQVWNEAYPTSGFWFGGMEDYINLIHKPAAKIIKDAGAKVVYGGWICGASSEEYTNLLTDTNSWNTIDVFDLHYHPISSMEYVYNEAKKHGIQNPSVWQTEMGFTADSTYAAVFYNKVFDWALSKWDPSNPDQFKLFWYAYGSPNDPLAYGYNYCLRNGSLLNNNGKELTTISSLLMGNEIKNFENFNTYPILKSELSENASSVEAFLLDNKKAVFAFHIAKQRGTNLFTDFNGSGNSTDVYFQNLKIKVNISGVADGAIVNRVDVFGNKTPLQVVKKDDGTTEVQVPVVDTNQAAYDISKAQGSMMTFYLEVNSPMVIDNGENPDPGDDVDTKVPTWPQGSTVTPSRIGMGGLTLTWTAAEDDIAVTGYKIYKGSDLMATVAGDVHSYEVTGLTAGTTYQFSIQARDGADNLSEDGPTNSVTTLSNSSGGNFGNGGGTAPATVQQTTNNQVGAGGIISVTPEQKGNQAIVKINESDLTKSAEKVTESSAGVKIIPIEVKKVAGVKDYVLELPASVFNSGVVTQKLQISTDIGTIIVPSNILTKDELTGTTKVEISLGMADKSTLEGNLKTQIGDRPLLEFNLKVNGTLKDWNNADAPVTVSIPYTPSASELAAPEHIVAWYIDGAVKVVPIPTGKYDVTTGAVIFETVNFGKYGVAFVNKTFNDIAKYQWAKKAIEVMASKGVVSGTSETTYNPEASINRADFIVMLVRALGLTAKTNENFTDVSSEAYYANAIAVAKELGITSGVGHNKFNPEAKITRQDMMALINNAMSVKKKNLTIGTDKDITQFADSKSVSSYAVQSVATLIKNEIVVGSGKNINPLGYATRAETAVMIYKIYNR